MTSNATCTTGSPASSNTITLSVNPIPVAEAGPDQSVCNGIPAVLSASGGGTYQWNTTETTSSISVTPASTTIYSVTVTLNGCTDVDTVTVSIGIVPTANAGVDQTICAGQTIALTATGGTTYSWNNGGNTATINVTPAVTNTYIVTVSQGGCTASDDIVVNVNPTPTANAGSDLDICSGNSANLVASGGTTYAWGPSGGLSNVNIANPVASPVSTTTYIVTVSNVQGCTSTDDIVVTVNPLPLANAGADQSMCDGGQLNLNASGGVTYFWDPSTGLSSTTIANPVASPQATTTYAVTVTDANLCSATDEITITVNPIPIVDAGNDTTVLIGQSVQLDASGGVSYQWTPSTYLNYSDVSNPTSTPLANISYVVYVMDGNGCSATDTVNINVDDATNIFIPSAFSPNNDGQNDVLYVRGKGIKELNFIIYDRWGEKVFETTDKTIGWDGTYKGKNLSTAVFTYYVKATYYDGNEIENKGNITLVR
jgi:gliding motility-associated-like protein